MGAQRGQNGLHAFTVVLPCEAGELAGMRMRARLVRRNGEHALAVAKPGEALCEQRLQLLMR